MDELQISGKRFISSRRVARDNGYTSDYVGQLIRGGKILGQKVGRAWYVDAASFDTFLGTTTPTKATAAGYIDLPAGKSAEVLPSSRLQPPSVVILPEPEVVAKSVKKEQEQEQEPVHVPLHIYKQSEPEAKTKTESTSGLRYYQDDEPALPHVVSPEEFHSIFNAESEPKEFVVRPSRPVLRFVALAGIAAVVFVGSALLSTAVSLNLSIEAGNAATVTYGLAK